jgi:hypothetical protein
VSGGCYVYQVSVTNGNIYTFKADGTDGSSSFNNAYIYLYNEAGTQLKYSSSGNVSYTSTYTGKAYVVIKGYNSSSYGNYTLAYKIIGKTPPNGYDATITPTTSWNTHAASISLGGNFVYRVNVEKGNTYTFKTDGDDGSGASFYAGIGVYNETGADINRNANLVGINTASYTFNYTGYAYVAVGVGNYTLSSGGYGSFTLAYKIIGKTPPTTYHYGLPNPTTSWQTHSASISLGGNYVYRVSVTSGNKYTFKTDGTNGSGASFYAGIGVYNDAGTDIDRNANLVGINTASYTFNYTGYAYVAVGVGNYTLSSGGYGSFTIAYRREP